MKARVRKPDAVCLTFARNFLTWLVSRYKNVCVVGTQLAKHEKNDVRHYVTFGRSLCCCL